LGDFKLKLGYRAFLKKNGFVFDKKPHQLDKVFLNSFSESERSKIIEIWALRNAVSSNNPSELYRLPKNKKQAALLFSHDANRMLNTMKWFDQIINEFAPKKVIEMGCGAGFLLSYLSQKYSNINFSGIENESSLAKIALNLLNKNVYSGSYLEIKPIDQYDLIICDFGFDKSNFKSSGAPHSTVEIEGHIYCSKCCDYLTEQFIDYLQAWRNWSHPNSFLAFTGRLSNFQEHRAFVLAAYECGWDLSVSRSKRIVFNKSNSSESVPGFIFKPSEISSSNEAESLLLDYYRLKTF
jgi:hypothetical protein